MKTLEDAKNLHGCLYLQMPVQEVSYKPLPKCKFNKYAQYGTLQFNKFEEIQCRGYHAAMAKLLEWDSNNLLPSVTMHENKGLLLPKRKGVSLRRNSI